MIKAGRLGQQVWSLLASLAYTHISAFWSSLKTDPKRLGTFMHREWPQAVESSIVIEAAVLLQFSFLLILKNL